MMIPILMRRTQPVTYIMTRGGWRGDDCDSAHGDHVDRENDHDGLEVAKWLLWMVIYCRLAVRDRCGRNKIHILVKGLCSCLPPSPGRNHGIETLKLPSENAQRWESEQPSSTSSPQRGQCSCSRWSDWFNWDSYPGKYTEARVTPECFSHSCTHWNQQWPSLHMAF